MATDVPPTFVRGGVWCADLRSRGGQRRVSLGLPATASEVAVGMALAQRLREMEVGALVKSPTLPGLDRPGLKVSALVDMYLDARAEDHATTGGRAYVADYCERVREGLGNLAVEDMVGKLGSAAMVEWRRLMWKRKWKGRTVRNALNMAMAILTWGQSDGRELTGQLPVRPKRFTETGAPMSRPCWDTMTEADFRTFRERVFDEALHWGSLNKRVGREHVADYIARRQLGLSFAFYTGAHAEDVWGVKGEDVSVSMGRYRRRNTKSARCVREAWFDMPEQLRLDFEAELTRRGIDRFPPQEIVTAGPWGPWKGATRTTQAACRRLWPDGSRPGFTFQVSRRSCVWEYTVRGWSAFEIATILGHVDTKMVEEVYRRCSELGIISPHRVPWTVASGPHGGPSRLAPVLPLHRKRTA